MHCYIWCGLFMVEDVDKTDVCLLSTITGSSFASNLEKSPAAFSDVVKLKIFHRPCWSRLSVFGLEETLHTCQDLRLTWLIKLCDASWRWQNISQHYHEAQIQNSSCIKMWWQLGRESISYIWLTHYICFFSFIWQLFYPAVTGKAGHIDTRFFIIPIEPRWSDLYRGCAWSDQHFLCWPWQAALWQLQRF